MASLSDTLISQAVGATNGGFDSLGAIKEGMGLAQTKQQLEQQKVKGEAMREEAEIKKFNFSMSGLQKIAFAPKSYSKQMAKQFSSAMERANIPHDPALLEQLATDDAIRIKMQRISELAPQMANDANARREVMGLYTDVYEADKGMTLFLDQLDKGRRVDVAQEKSEAQVEIAGLRMEEKRTKEQTDRVLKAQDKAITLVNKELGGKFQEKKSALRAVKGTFGILKDRYKETGEVPPIVVENLAAGLAKLAAPGALSEGDITRLTKLPGLEALTEDAFRKWLSGGVASERVNQLGFIIANSAKIAQQETQEKVNKIKKQIDPDGRIFSPEDTASIFQRSGLDDANTPLIEEAELEAFLSGDYLDYEPKAKEQAGQSTGTPTASAQPATPALPELNERFNDATLTQLAEAVSSGRRSEEEALNLINVYAEKLKTSGRGAGVSPLKAEATQKLKSLISRAKKGV